MHIYSHIDIRFTDIRLLFASFPNFILYKYLLFNATNHASSSTIETSPSFISFNRLGFGVCLASSYYHRHYHRRIIISFTFLNYSFRFGCRTLKTRARSPSRLDIVAYCTTSQQSACLPTTYHSPTSLPIYLPTSLPTYLPRYTIITIFFVIFFLLLGGYCIRRRSAWIRVTLKDWDKICFSSVSNFAPFFITSSY